VPLTDAPMRVLGAALRDPAVVARYRAKVLEVPGSDCLWWQGAVSGRGHGRFYVGTVPTGPAVPSGSGTNGGGGEGVTCDLCVIAHRFGYALVYGAAVLNEVPVLGHGCDNPLCQRICAGHVHPSSHAANRRAFLARLSLAGSPLGDPRGARGRSRELRDMTRAGPAAVAADQARLLRLGLQLPLFDVPARQGSHRLGAEPLGDHPVQQHG
jgi:hypothetical protein